MALVSLAVAGCGYALRQPGAVKVIRIANIDNLTSEPALGEAVITHLARELARRGIAVRHDADYAIGGMLSSFDVKSAAEQSGVAVLYEATLNGEFHLLGPDGGRQRLQTGGPLLVTFSSEGPLASLDARRDAARDRAAADLAGRIASALVYRQ